MRFGVLRFFGWDGMGWDGEEVKGGGGMGAVNRGWGKWANRLVGGSVEGWSGEGRLGWMQ